MIEITPLSPSSDDNVVFEFTGVTRWCSVIKESHTESHFTYTALEIATPCAPEYDPFEISFDVGRLKAGAYQVTYVDARDGGETMAFSVSEGVLPFPVPTIPTIGITGAIVLAIGLAWIANKALKRTHKCAT